MEQHHIRYKEIHGEDEIILLSKNEHMKVHAQDKANDFKPIPVSVIKAAHARSPIGKAFMKEYNESDVGRAQISKNKCSENGKARDKRYRQSETGKRTAKAYREFTQRISFSETLERGTRLCESIDYNHKTGEIYYHSAFRGSHCTLTSVEVT